ncbi:hypothetical protein BD410DRAFT_486230 [Rickenella mellea]|uniref:Uncharacterized protein n=1 Tax=Rickenella mellea TaxID=50990 RepID=A0A4Y7QIQ5_9AGAM|nr:hypothetical protein BD410DRAFT_486230 [Rickenella mellea]
MTFRWGTVANLYIRLNELKFLQVRGTPASGKSTLASLLFNHIHKVEGKVPHWISNWPAPGTPAGTPKPEFNQYAKGWTWGDNSVVIIDEAQQTYWDGSLWDDYFKPLCNDPINRENRIIIFSSYGSPNRAMAGGTLWDVPSANRISFHETIPPPGHEPVGLFFTKDEFKDYVSRRTILHQHKFDSQLLDEIFNLTAGHVGAFEEMFRTLVAQDWYRRPQTHTFTVTDFENLNPYDLLGGLEGRSIFSRGLPKAEQLHVPGIANVFNQVLCEGKITTPTPTHPTRLPGGDLGTCFQNGWLHAVRTEDDGVTYIFATPLHRWFVEWKLFGIPQGPNFALLYTSMLEFSFRAFSRFSPTLLSKERLIDSGPPQITQSTPEAQFQHEFYRACFDLSKGQVITFPEFGTAKGRADFYIPSMKWGIELLRNGDRLEEHVCRFNSTGKYGKTLPLTDYIILDCRFSKPIKTHPRLLKMYHVVFTYSNQPGLNRLWTFEILDNNLNLMPGMQGALTSSN